MYKFYSLHLYPLDSVYTLSTPLISCCEVMAPKTQKHHCSPSESRPAKKAKGPDGVQIRQSNHSGKGTGGAAKQLWKAGDAVASQSKRRVNAFKDAGEGLNPMAPESPTRKSKKVISDVVVPFKSWLHPTFRARSLLWLLMMTAVSQVMYFLQLLNVSLLTTSLWQFDHPGRVTRWQNFQPWKIATGLGSNWCMIQFTYLRNLLHLTFDSHLLQDTPRKPPINRLWNPISDQTLWQLDGNL